MKRLFSAILFFLCLYVHSQTFWDSTYTHIPDTSKIGVQLNISGLPPQIDTSFGVSSVCLNITHSFDQDLVIQLKSPDGNVITLAGGVGNNGHDFTNTCFAENGTNGYITSGTAPFSGTFIPQQSLNVLNNGQNPNGIWTLIISDANLADTGSYHNCKINFSTSPPPDPPIPPIVCTYCTCANNADTCDLLPDVTASALCIQQYHLEGPGNIQIANATPNIGRGPIEVHSIDSCFCDTVPVACTTVVCPGGKAVKHSIIQRIYQRTGNDTLSHYDRKAGLMTFHHAGHLHIDHWTDFSLRMATVNPDATTWPILGTSAKQSFCLINLEDCTNAYGYCMDTNNNVLTMSNISNAGFGLYTGCGLDQGIYPGYLDVYDIPLNDPIIFNNICNGTYNIVSITDPENNFLESNENNNWVSVPVTLTQQSSPSGNSSYNYSVNGLQATFINTSPSGNTYLWNFGDGSWDTTYNPIHTYTAAGTYSVSLISLNQCFAMTSQVIAITGMNEYQKANLNLRVYPNPLTQNSSVTYYVSGNSHVHLEITDLSGRKIATLVDENQKQGVQKIFLKNIYLRPGVYFLYLDVNNHGSDAVKIIKT